MKTILLLLLCSMVPFLVIAIISYQSAKDVLEKKIGLELQSGSQQAMDRLENTLEKSIINFQAWSASLIMQDVLTDDTEEDIAKTLVNLKSQYQHFAGFLVVNDKGVVIASNDKKNLKKNLLADVAVKTALEGKLFQGTVGTSDLVLGKSLTLSIPIRADYDTETIIGALVGFVDWSSIRTILLSTDVSGTRQSLSNFLILRSSTGKNLLFITPEAKINVGQMPGVAGVTSFSIGKQEVLVGTATSKGLVSFVNPNWIIHQVVTTKKAYAGVFELSYARKLVTGEKAAYRGG